MSEENVERWRELNERISTGRIDELADLFEPDYVHHMRADEPEARTLTSFAEYEQLIATWSDTFEEFRAEIHELIDRGDTVVAVTTLHGRGRGSGAEVHEPYVFVTRYRNGKMAETHEYATKEEALASLDE